MQIKPVLFNLLCAAILWGGIKDSEASVRLWFLSSGKLHLTALNIIKSLWDSHSRAAAVGSLGSFENAHRERQTVIIDSLLNTTSGQMLVPSFPWNLLCVPSHHKMYCHHSTITLEAFEGIKCAFFPSHGILCISWHMAGVQYKLNWFTAWDHVLAPINRTLHTSYWQYWDYRGHWQHSA